MEIYIKIYTLGRWPLEAEISKELDFPSKPQKEYSPAILIRLLTSRIVKRIILCFSRSDEIGRLQADRAGD